MNLNMKLITTSKGKNIVAITNFNLPNSDKFYFADELILKIMNLPQKILKYIYIKIYLIIIKMTQECIHLKVKTM